jgi:hypothetical protein
VAAWINRHVRRNYSDLNYGSHVLACLDIALLPYPEILGANRLRSLHRPTIRTRYYLPLQCGCLPLRLHTWSLPYISSEELAYELEDPIGGSGISQHGMRVRSDLDLHSHKNNLRADSLRPTQIVEQSGRVCSENLVHANTGQHHGSYFVLHYPPDTVESTVMDKNRDQPESSYPKSSLLFYSTLGLTWRFIYKLNIRLIINQTDSIRNEFHIRCSIVHLISSLNPQPQEADNSSAVEIFSPSFHESSTYFMQDRRGSNLSKPEIHSSKKHRLWWSTRSELPLSHDVVDSTGCWYIAKGLRMTLPMMPIGKSQHLYTVFSYLLTLVQKKFWKCTGWPCQDLSRPLAEGASLYFWQAVLYFPR